MAIRTDNPSSTGTIEKPEKAADVRRPADLKLPYGPVPGGEPIPTTDVLAYGPMSDSVAALANVRPTPVAAPIPGNDPDKDKKTDRLTTSGRNLTEEEALLHREHRTSVFNSADGQYSSRQMDDEQYEANKEKERRKLEEEATEEQPDKNDLWEWLVGAGEVAAVVEAADKARHHHHIARDLHLLYDAEKAARDAERARQLERDEQEARKVEEAKKAEADAKRAEEAKKAEEAKRLEDAKKAELAEKAKLSGQDVHRIDETGHDIKRTGQEIYTGERLAADVHKFDELIHRASALPRIVKHIAVGGAVVGAIFGGGFIAKRITEGLIIHELAMQTHPEKADEWAQNVMTRLPFTKKEAIDEWNKGDLLSRANAIRIEGSAFVTETLSDVKALYDYLKDPENREKIKKEFAEAQDAAQALAILHKEKPEEWRKIMRDIAKETGMLEGVITENGEVSVDAIYHGMMHDTQQAKQDIATLKTAALEPSGTTKRLIDEAAETKNYLTPVIDTVKARPNGMGASMPLPQPDAPHAPAAKPNTPKDELR